MTYCCRTCCCSGVVATAAASWAFSRCRSRSFSKASCEQRSSNHSCSALRIGMHAFKHSLNKAIARSCAVGSAQRPAGEGSGFRRSIQRERGASRRWMGALLSLPPRRSDALSLVAACAPQRPATIQQRNLLLSAPIFLLLPGAEVRSFSIPLRRGPACLPRSPVQAHDGRRWRSSPTLC